MLSNTVININIFIIFIFQGIVSKLDNMFFFFCSIVVVFAGTTESIHFTIKKNVGGRYNALYSDKGVVIVTGAVIISCIIFDTKDRAVIHMISRTYVSFYNKSKCLLWKSEKKVKKPPRVGNIWECFRAPSQADITETHTDFILLSCWILVVCLMWRNVTLELTVHLC